MNSKHSSSETVAIDMAALPKVLMPIGDATEALDTLYPFFRVAEDGYRAVVAGPEARTYHMVLHEIPPASGIPWDITEERPGYHIRAEIAFRDVRPEEYVGLFISGGRAPEYLRYDQDLLRITRHFFEANKPVAVVCHGIEILSAAGVVRGRTATTVAKCALDAQQGGATYVDKPIVVDHNLVSARTWHDNAPFMSQFMKMLRATLVVGLLLSLVAGVRAGDDFKVEAGYANLFNGHDLTGWKYGMEMDLSGRTETSDKRFRVVGGVIVAEEGKGIRDLYTIQSFNKDFHLKLEFRASLKADSGVYVRGPQLQVRDFIRRGEMKQLKKFKNDDWNELDITVKGTVAKCLCNAEFMENMKVPQSSNRGIGLQAETGKFEFRRIRIKELP